ncbi:hypothetical protein AVEN_187992-1 [Araneus ventricosus]|uniref:Uncharacterized protein n=1 Tax=Araneus ventricosus TaxID=182803 RepID=A0A4Y2J5Q4_ARAVE|nr:hypothetical protein AVEN_187992-1 [Araneus ventricosus]
MHLWFPFPVNRWGCGSLVVRLRLWGWTDPGSKPDSIEQPPCKKVWCASDPTTRNVLPLVLRGKKKKLEQTSFLVCLFACSWDFRLTHQLLTRRPRQSIWHCGPYYERLMRRLLRQSLVILASRSEATRGLLWDRPRHFEPRSDDEDNTCADTPSPNFCTTPTGGCLTPYATDPTHDGSSVESGFEPGALRSRSRDLTTRPPQPPLLI